MKKFGWAFIGCGGIAHITALELVRTKDNTIVSAWNRTASKAESFVKKFGGTAYATIEEAINAPGVEGVYIAVTADRHADIMKLCIQHHKPVLCEKPFTVNEQQAREVLELAAAEGVYVSEAMWTWHNATAKQVKEWIRQEAVGQVKQVNCDYSFPMIKMPIQKPRHTSPEMIGGAIMDIGIYCIRYCYELFGMPREMICNGRLSGGIDLGEKITLRYDGFDCNIRVSRDENDGERLEIIGEKGRIYLPMFHMAKKATLKTDKKQVFRDRSLLYGTQFSAVAAEIRSGAKEGIAITPQSTLDCLKITDICRQQMGLVYPCEE
jgi:predicted dehydrogenase